MTKKHSWDELGILNGDEGQNDIKPYTGGYDRQNASSNSVFDTESYSNDYLQNYNPLKTSLDNFSSRSNTPNDDAYFKNKNANMSFMDEVEGFLNNIGNNFNYSANNNSFVDGFKNNNYDFLPSTQKVDDVQNYKYDPSSFTNGLNNIGKNFQYNQPDNQFNSGFSTDNYNKSLQADPPTSKYNEINYSDPIPTYEQGHNLTWGEALNNSINTGIMQDYQHKENLLKMIFGNNNTALNQSQNYLESAAQQYQNNLKDLTGVKNFVATGVQAMPEMADTMVLGGELGAAAKGLGAGAKLAEAAQMLPFAAQAGAGYAREAENDGASFGQQLAYGTLGGLAEGFTEKPIVSNWIDLMGGQLGKSLINEGANTLVSKYGKLGLEYLKDIGKEAWQEAAVDPLTGLAKKLVYKPDMNWTGKDGVFDGSQMAQDAYGGAAMSVVMAALGLPHNLISHKMASHMVENNIKPTPEDVQAIQNQIMQDMSSYNINKDVYQNPGKYNPGNQTLYTPNNLNDFTTPGEGQDITQTNYPENPSSVQANIPAANTVENTPNNVNDAEIQANIEDNNMPTQQQNPQLTHSNTDMSIGDNITESTLGNANVPIENTTQQKASTVNLGQYGDVQVLHDDGQTVTVKSADGEEIPMSKMTFDILNTASKINPAQPQTLETTPKTAEVKAENTNTPNDNIVQQEAPKTQLSTPDKIEVGQRYNLDGVGEVTIKNIINGQLLEFKDKDGNDIKSKINTNAFNLLNPEYLGNEEAPVQETNTPIENNVEQNLSNKAKILSNGINELKGESGLNTIDYWKYQVEGNHNDGHISDVEYEHLNNLLNDKHKSLISETTIKKPVLMQTTPIKEQQQSQQEEKQPSQVNTPTVENTADKVPIEDINSGETFTGVDGKQYEIGEINKKDNQVSLFNHTDGTQEITTLANARKVKGYEKSIQSKFNVGDKVGLGNEVVTIKSIDGNIATLDTKDGEKKAHVSDINKHGQSVYNSTRVETPNQEITNQKQEQLQDQGRAKLLNDLEEEHKKTVETINKGLNHDEGLKNKKLKAEGMRYAAKKRELIQGDSLEPVDGGLTTKELKAKNDRLKGNYIGKTVNTPDGTGIVRANPFGKVAVEFTDENGKKTSKTYDKKDITEYKENNHIADTSQKVENKPVEFNNGDIINWKGETWKVADNEASPQYIGQKEGNLIELKTTERIVGEVRTVHKDELKDATIISKFKSKEEAPKAKQEPEVKKEPYEMTKAEFEKIPDKFDLRQEAAKEKIIEAMKFFKYYLKDNGFIKKDESENSFIHRITSPERKDGKVDFTKTIKNLSTKDLFGNTRPGEKLRKMLLDYAEHRKNQWTEKGEEFEIKSFEHKSSVKEALAQGKKVPEEVLKQYPELLPKKEEPRGILSDAAIKDVTDIIDNTIDAIDSSWGLRGGRDRMGNFSLSQSDDENVEKAGELNLANKVLNNLRDKLKKAESNSEIAEAIENSIPELKPYVPFIDEALQAKADYYSNLQDSNDETKKDLSLPEENENKDKSKGKSTSEKLKSGKDLIPGEFVKAVPGGRLFEIIDVRATDFLAESEDNYKARYRYKFKEPGTTPAKYKVLSVDDVIKSHEDSVKRYKDRLEKDPKYEPDIKSLKWYERRIEELKGETKEAKNVTTPKEKPKEVVKKPLGSKESQQIADQVNKWLSEKHKFTSKELYTIADSAYNGTQAENKYAVKDAMDAMELGVNQFLLNQKEVDLTAKDAETVKKNIQWIKENVLDIIPTQYNRTTEQQEFQQFSTPPTIAYLVNWLADTNKNDTVLEPSAGIGGLAVFGKINGAKVIANELSDKRLDVLKNMGFDEYYNEDAEQLHNILPDSVKPTVVEMNPPFSSSQRTKGKNDTKNATKHIEQALNRLEEGGRLVAVVGQGMSDDAATFKSWWKDIKAKYNVRANIGLGRSDFVKYGTGFGTQIFIIDKTGPTSEKTITGNFENLNQIIDKLEGIQSDRQSVSTESQSGEQPADKPGNTKTSEENGGSNRSEQPVSSSTDSVGDGNRTNEGGIPTRDNESDGKNGERVTTDDKSNESSGDTNRAGTSEIRDNESEGSENSTDGSGLSNGNNGDVANTPGNIELKPKESDNKKEDTKTDEVKADNTTLDINTKTKEEQKTQNKNDLGDSVYTDYEPQKLKTPGAKQHPGKLSQSAAMAAVEPPDPTYKPNLPKELIDSGKLSNAQLEATVYAGQAHEQILPNGYRKGFFIGDGTGVGKGREVSSIILDNFRQGRKKAIWISKNGPLFDDAKRDWGSLGQDIKQVTDLSKTKVGNKIDKKEGIVFTTYGTIPTGLNYASGGKNKDLKPGNLSSRLEQLVDWVGKDFDGVIVFDEAHQMANVGNAKQEGTQAAQAGILLQKRLPNARIVYASATGATEVSNLGYASRLGLWGPGTPFANEGDFVSKIDAGGLAAMELVSRDMKSMGNYISRNLSYDGVGYENLTHNLTADQKEMYDTIADAWQIIFQNMNEVLNLTNQNRNSKAKRYAKGQFWSSNQRFFNSLMTTLSMPSVLKDMEQRLANNECPVLQIVNTNEAEQDRQLTKMKEEEGTLDDVDLSPKGTLLAYLDKAFPTTQFEDYIDDDGKVQTRPAVDTKTGKPLENKEAVKIKKQLMEQIGAMKMPEGPIDMIINKFGVDNVAEITGRKNRIVTDKNGKKMEQKLSNGYKTADTNAFMDGKKKILIFSDAGGTGKSYHASNDVKNQRHRVHYLLQAGWEAKKAVQGFGRTHRTNEASSPTYVLVSTNLKGQKRFISTIARRLDQLGALTKGQRQAGSSGMFKASDNLENNVAKDALSQFFKNVYNEKYSNIDKNRFFKETGLNEKLIDKHGKLNNNSPEMKNVPHFLNRILSLKSDFQNGIFDAYTSMINDMTEYYREHDMLDEGLENLKADKIKTLESQDILKDQNGTTSYHQLELSNKTQPVSFDDITNHDPKNRMGFYYNKVSKRIYAAYQAGTRTLDSGKVVDTVRLYTQENGKTSRADFIDIENNKNYEKLTDNAAAPLWNEAIKALPEYNKEKIHLISGTLLPVWDKLPNGNMKVVRALTDEGNMYLGRVIKGDQIDTVLRRLGASRNKENYKAKDVIAKVLNDKYSVNLANGWKIQRKKVSGEYRLELLGNNLYSFRNELEKYGVFQESIQYNTRYFIPTGDKAAEVLQKIIDGRKAAIESVMPPEDGKNEMAMGIIDSAKKAVEKSGNVKANYLDEICATLDDESYDPKVKAQKLAEYLLNPNNTAKNDPIKDFVDNLYNAQKTDNKIKNKLVYAIEAMVKPENYKDEIKTAFGLTESKYNSNDTALKALDNYFSGVVDKKANENLKSTESTVENAKAATPEAQPVTETTKTKANNDLQGASEGTTKKERQTIVNSFMNSEAIPQKLKDFLKANPEMWTYIEHKNEDAMKAARTYVENNFKEAVARINDLDNFRDDMDTAIALELEKKYLEDGDFEAAQELSGRIAKFGTGLGQAIQYFSTLKRMSPTWSLNHVQRKINDTVTKDQRRTLEKQSKKVADEMNKANQSVIGGVINKLKEILHLGNDEIAATSEKNPDKMLAEKISRHLSTTKAKDDPITNMVKTLYNVAKQTLPEKAKVNTKTPIDFIKEAINNADEYAETWEKAKKIVKSRYENNEAAKALLDEYFEQFLDKPFSDKQLTSAVKRAIKENNIDLGKLVREHYSKVDATGQSLADKLTEEGLEPGAAESLASFIQGEFARQSSAKKEMILGNMFKENPRKGAKYKEFYQKVIELSNLGAFSNERYKDAVAQKYKIPRLTAEATAKIKKLSNEVQTQKQGTYEYDAAVSRLLDYMDSQIPLNKLDTLLKHANALQIIAMLTNTKTASRNYISNLMFGGLTHGKDYMRTGIDKIVGAKTGYRTSVNPSVSSKWEGSKEGRKTSNLDWKNGINTKDSNNKTEIGRRKVYGKSVSENKYIKGADKIMGKIEDTMGWLMDDRPFMTAAVKDNIRKQMILAKMNGEKFNIDDAIEKANEEGAYVTFNDKTWLSKNLVKAQKALNGGRYFGIGSIMMRFARTPANIFMRSIDYSPVSYAKAFYHAGKISSTEEGHIHQEKFADDLAKAFTGTAMIGLGIFLAKIGAMILDRDKDKDKNQFDKQTGIGNFKINITSFLRAAENGFNPEAGGLQEGDLLVSFDWAVPMATSLIFGGQIEATKTPGQARTVWDNISNYTDAIGNATNGMLNQSMLQNVSKLFSSYTTKTEAIKDIFASIPSSFVPSVLNQVRQLTDNQTRETYSENGLDQVTNKVKARMPGLSNTLPNAVDSIGRDAETYQSDSIWRTNNIFNVLLNPAITTRFKPTQAEQVVKDIYDSTGNKIQFPRVVDKTLDLGDVGKIKLTTEEYLQYQRLMGQGTVDILNQYTDLIGSTDKESLNDAAKEIQKGMTALNKDVKEQIANGRGITSSKGPNNKVTWTDENSGDN